MIFFQAATKRDKKREILSVAKNKSFRWNALTEAEEKNSYAMDVYNMYVGDCANTYRNNMFRDYEKHPYGKCLPSRLRRPTFVKICVRIFI